MSHVATAELSTSDDCKKWIFLSNRMFLIKSLKENVTSNDADTKDKKPGLEAGQPEVPPTPASKPQ